MPSDDNLRTDVSWIKRLAGREQSARSMLEQILLENTIPYDEKMLRSKFNMEQFFLFLVFFHLFSQLVLSPF